MVDERPLAGGDDELTADLRALAGQRARRVAAALVDLHDSPKSHFAFIDAESTTGFEIGSITKALTGMALGCAVERGDSSLDGALASLYPQSAGTAFGAVTVKELCTHTSGLPRLPRNLLTLLRAERFLLTGSNPYRGTTASGVLEDGARQRLRRRGERRYSNLGGAVLGQVLAGAAGTDYGSLLRERIFMPLRMADSFVAGPRTAAQPGWSSLGRRRSPWVMGGYAPAGGVVSTIDDMARLAVGLLEGTAPGSNSLNAIGGVETGRPNRATGMFWVIDSDPRTSRTMIWHNGQTGGYSSFIGLFPQTGRAVAVLANVAHAAEQRRVALGLARRFRQL